MTDDDTDDVGAGMTQHDRNHRIATLRATRLVADGTDD